MEMDGAADPRGPTARSEVKEHRGGQSEGFTKLNTVKSLCKPLTLITLMYS